jgi:D-alanyl-D-alanine dipeptidase
MSDFKGRLQESDVGTGFDFFSTKSRPDNPSMTPAQRAHRMLLQVIMKKHGFKPYVKEW